MILLLLLLLLLLSFFTIIESIADNESVDLGIAEVVLSTATSL